MAATAVLAQQGRAQTNWIQRNPVVSPPPRGNGTMAYDSVRARAVLFGGSSDISHLNDTWEWDGSTWHERNPASRPSIRVHAAMAYDSARACMVLFAGTYDILGDTWEWDGSNWTRRALTADPPARVSHSVVYDSGRARTVLFGGLSRTNVVLGETWEWDGTSWGQRQPATIPPPRHSHDLAYDSARGRTVMFGGYDGTRFYSDTWEWDGSNWSLMAPATRPPERQYHAMTFDSARRRTVLFAGYHPAFLRDTWEWDGTNWTQRSPSTSPAMRYFHAMAFDSARERVVLFGGRTAPNQIAIGDTWEYAPDHPAAFTPFGVGCPNPGAPELGADQGLRPWLGDTFAVRLGNLGSNPAVYVPFLILGSSDASWGSTRLPLDLGFLRMPGCALFTNPELTFQLTNRNGIATWSFFIPEDVSLLGARLFAQGLVTSPEANRLGVAASSAGAMRFGAR